MKLFRKPDPGVAPPADAPLDRLHPDAVIPQLRAGNKKQVLQELSRRAAEITGLGETVILTTLLDRERLGSTGIGRGIAIPHGKIEGLDRVHAVFARLERGIDFDAIDEQPVDLVYLMLTPAGSGPDHLKALARISRFLRNASVCDKIRGSTTADAIYALMHEAAERSAA